jgi:hypothetical protein
MEVEHIVSLDGQSLGGPHLLDRVIAHENGAILDLPPRIVHRDQQARMAQQ